MPAQVIVKDAYGNNISRTDYAYDGATPSPTITGAAGHNDSYSNPRANLTTVTRYSDPVGGTGALGQDALKNPDCANAVGKAMDDFGDTVTAADVLSDLANNVEPAPDTDQAWPPAHYGKIVFGPIDQPPDAPNTVTSATTTSTGISGIYTVTVQINTARGSFVSGSTEDEAVTLLNELGHAMNALFTDSSSQVRDDSDATPAGRKQSQDNTALIRQKCFPKKKK